MLCKCHCTSTSSSKAQLQACSSPLSAVAVPVNSADAHLPRGWLMTMWPPGRSIRQHAHSASCWSCMCAKLDLKKMASTEPKGAIVAARSTMSPHQVCTCT